MRQIVFIMLIVVAILSITVVMQDASAQTAVIDEQNITYDKEKPAFSDTITITAPVVFVDAEPVEDGVVLEWKLCTETKCEIPTKTVMTETAPGTYSATIGPFPEKDDMGDPYIDIGFTVEVTYVPVGGGDEQKIESEEITIYFEQGSTNNGNGSGTDDDTNGVDDNSEDSPFGFELAVMSSLIAVLLIMISGRRRK